MRGVPKNGRRAPSSVQPRPARLFRLPPIIRATPRALPLCRSASSRAVELHGKRRGLHCCNHQQDHPKRHETVSALATEVAVHKHRLQGGRGSDALWRLAAPPEAFAHVGRLHHQRPGDQATPMRSAASRRRESSSTGTRGKQQQRRHKTERHAARIGWQLTPVLQRCLVLQRCEAQE